MNIERIEKALFIADHEGDDDFRERRIVDHIVALNTALTQARQQRNLFQHEAAVAATQAVNYKAELSKLNRIMSGLR